MPSLSEVLRRARNRVSFSDVGNRIKEVDYFASRKMIKTNTFSESLNGSVVAYASVDTLRLRLYPGTDDRVSISHKAAFHLEDLLHRYNACLVAGSGNALRWRTFWKGITQVERDFMVMVVRANCEGHFGNRICVLDGVPKPEARVKRSQPINDDVLSEFIALMDVFHAALTSRDEIDMLWMEKCPQERKLLLSIGALDTVLATYYNPQKVEQYALEAFIDVGIEEPAAQQHASALALQLIWFLACQMDALDDDAESLPLH